MSGIVLSSGVRQNLQSIQQNADVISRTQNRLATGKKVNSALDNPTNFFTASALNSRAGDLSGLLDGISNALKTVETADNAIKAMTKLVESAQATARQALQAGSNANGSATSTVNAVAGDSANGTAAATTLTLKSGTGPNVDFAVAVGETKQQVVDKINASNTGFKAEFVDSATAGQKNIKISTTNGTNISVTGDAEAGVFGAGLATETAANAAAPIERAAFAKQFNDLRKQIDQLSKDSSFNGKNLLNGDSIEVVFNEKLGSEKSNLTISGTKFDAAGLGVAEAQNSFASTGDIEAAVTNLTNALSTLRTQSSVFGSNLAVVQTRQDFTKSMVNTLKGGADNLTLADSNEEGANLLSLQTRQQLSTTALSLATQADQNVLRLF